MIVGDKIRLKKKMGVFDNIGEICEVTEIQDGGVICFKFGEGKHLGCMSYDEYEKYFDKVEEPVKRKLTGWKKQATSFTNPFSGQACAITIEYRDNGKRVEIRKVLDDKTIKGIATCCKNDKFKMITGYELAKKRFVIKYLKYELDKLTKEM